MSRAKPSLKSAAEGLTPAKKRLIEHLKTSGAATPAELADVFGHTEVAMRQHLQVLAEEGWVQDRKRPRAGRGRPAMEWTLTERSMGLFPDRHGELTVDLLDAARRAFGQDGLDKMLAVRADDQTAHYRKLLQGRATLLEQAHALAEERTREGYMAEAVKAQADGDPDDKNGGAVLLIEHHCPVCEAAKACAGLCAGELDVFRRSLGDGVRVERTRHLLQDGDRCVYRLTPTAGRK